MTSGKSSNSFHLWKALAEGRKAQTRYDRLAEQIDQAGSELADAHVLATQSEQTLNNLIQLAGLTSLAEIESLLAHFDQRNAVQAQIDNLRNALSGLARGRAVDEFVSKVRDENPDALWRKEKQKRNETKKKRNQPSPRSAKRCSGLAQW